MSTKTANAVEIVSLPIFSHHLALGFPQTLVAATVDAHRTLLAARVLTLDPAPEYFSVSRRIRPLRTPAASIAIVSSAAGEVEKTNLAQWSWGWLTSQRLRRLEAQVLRWAPAQ